VQTKLLAEQPLRLHHHAYAVKDQEVNRHFIEDILGIPLVATWCERVFFPDVGREVEFCHTFFEVKDGWPGIAAPTTTTGRTDPARSKAQEVDGRRVGTWSAVRMRVGRSVNLFKARTDRRRLPFSDGADAFSSPRDVIHARK
jgi:catechol 2,3-dioxygenase-like lactoylglutathione lyase family enzyme